MSGTLLRQMPKHPAVEAGRAKILRRVYVWACHCVKCGYRWEATGAKPPEHCSSCHMSSWWIKRPRGRPPKERAA